MLFLDISHIALMFPFNWGKLVSMLVCIRDRLDRLFWNIGSLNYWWLLILTISIIFNGKFLIAAHKKIVVGRFKVVWNFPFHFFLIFSTATSVEMTFSRSFHEMSLADRSRMDLFSLSSFPFLVTLFFVFLPKFKIPK